MKIKRNKMEIVLKLRQICILALNMNFNFDVNIGRAYLPRLFSAFHRLRFPVIGMEKISIQHDTAHR